MKNKLFFWPGQGSHYLQLSGINFKHVFKKKKNYNHNNDNLFLSMRPFSKKKQPPF